MAANEAQKRRNRNNRKRGAHFEKVVADLLDMDVVPYSGSNMRFGLGDVRDSIWLGECKNISIKDGRCKVQTEWINDNIGKARMYKLSPFLAWMPAGRSEKYVILDQETFNRLGVADNITVEIPKKAVTAVNIFIDINSSYMIAVRGGKIAQLKFGDSIYHMMAIQQFKTIIEDAGLKGVRQNYGT